MKIKLENGNAIEGTIALDKIRKADMLNEFRTMVLEALREINVNMGEQRLELESLKE